MTPNPILSDELVERAARAAFEERRRIWNMKIPWAECKGGFLDDARAALEAVLPDLIEACAKDMEMFYGQHPANHLRRFALRALTPSHPHTPTFKQRGEVMGGKLTAEQESLAKLVYDVWVKAVDGPSWLLFKEIPSVSPDDYGALCEVGKALSVRVAAAHTAGLLEALEIAQASVNSIRMAREKQGLHGSEANAYESAAMTVHQNITARISRLQRSP